MLVVEEEEQVQEMVETVVMEDNMEVMDRTAKYMVLEEAEVDALT